MHPGLFEHYVYRKHNRVSFPFGAKRVKGILDLVHSDVFGLVLVRSLGNFVYYAYFIDDF